MEKKTITELMRNNKIAMLAHVIDVTVMTTFCFLQTLSKMQTWTYIIIVAILGFVPIIAEYMFWKQNKETTMVKHLVAIGFAVFYTFTLFTSTNNIVFAFVIPMILVTSIYKDIRYSLLINVGTVLESIIVVIIGFKTGKFGFADTDSAIIQVVIMILVAIYSLLTSKTINENMQQQLETIRNAQNKTELVLSNLSKLTEKVKTGINEIYLELEKLNKASNETKEAMSEVSIGATDTAEAVQKQILQTEDIQNKVDVVSNVATKISESMEQTLIVLKDEYQDIELLSQKVEISVQNSVEVAEKLETLDNYMKEMNSIVELINGITSQTGLLALNASIEAARAGEAGRGFSVVATEISGMASQTSNATVHITKLINNVSGAINEVVSVIHQMINGINEQKQSTANTVNSFNTIQSNTYSIKDNITDLTHNVIKLKEANQVIVDSIQTISAVSEEVSAHSNETMNSEEENAIVLDRIATKMQELMDLTNTDNKN